MDRLEMCVAILKKRVLYNVREHLLDTLIDSQTNSFSEGKDIPLIGLARTYRLENVLHVWDETLKAIDNFIQNIVAVNKLPSAMLESLTDYIEQETQCVVKYFSFFQEQQKQKLLHNFHKLFASKEKGNEQDVEKHTAFLHTQVENILKVFKSTAIKLKDEGLLSKLTSISESATNQSESDSEEEILELYTEYATREDTPRRRRSSSCRTKYIRDRLAVYQLPTAYVPIRKLSFQGSNLIKASKVSGEFEILNLSVIDFLLLELPMKYDFIR